jgi:hypothetical protein
MDALAGRSDAARVRATHIAAVVSTANRPSRAPDRSRDSQKCAGRATHASEMLKRALTLSLDDLEATWVAAEINLCDLSKAGVRVDSVCTWMKGASASKQRG